jgi:transposase
VQDIGKDALREKEATLFPCGIKIFLYDLTNTYFEGRCLNNKLAKRGKSKEERTDCPLVTLALVVDFRGFPVFSQIYEGNQSEPETLKDVLNCLKMQEENLFQELRPTIVMDRGIATKKNIELLKSMQYPYIIIERRAEEKEYTEEFQQVRETFELINPEQPVYVKKIAIEQGCRILCWSGHRAQKEVTMDTLHEQRFIQDLTWLRTSVSKRNILMVEKVFAASVIGFVLTARSGSPESRLRIGKKCLLCQSRGGFKISILRII